MRGAPPPSRASLAEGQAKKGVRMVEIVIGVLLILTFLGMVWYCVKGHNIMVGFFVMALLWMGFSLVGNALVPNPAMEGQSTLKVFQYVFQTGPENYAKSILVNVFFGAFFGRVLMDTGIAATLIRKVVELGGDRPKITMTLLCIVTTLIFTSMTGIGPVISIAVIVLPILAALGIPTAVALFAFMGSIMAGICANVTNFTQYQGILGGFDPRFLSEYSYSQYFPFAVVMAVVVLVVVTIVSNIAMSGKKSTRSWAAQAQAAQDNAPWFSWISVILPVILIVAVKSTDVDPATGKATVTSFSVILSFIISALYALLTTGKLFKGGFTECCRRLAKEFADGAVDVAPMVGFLLTLSMFSNAATYAAPYFQAVVGNLIPTSALAICILFAVVIPLGFFRGPTNLVGSGTAVAALVLSVAQWPVAFMYPVLAVATIVPQHLDITQSWVAWGLGYSKVSSRDFMKMTIPTAWIAGAILCLVAFVMYGGLVA